VFARPPIVHHPRCNMGVPKFYKWLSERYPLINQVANADIRPEFDNMYLDMNGIIHNATHGDVEEDGRTRALSEEQMLTNVFKYLEKLFAIARPKKLLYMAIDGVAPRAKMNQQRQRRFRAAKDARENMEAMRRRGEDVDPNTVFDSNCITPGTAFMNSLSTHLRYFVRKKMKEDIAWQNIKVIFSGAEVPGEGEHKIMLYIRNMKSQPGYDPNLRHCLYGLDADLVMLSLASHEPHFALLREEVVFGNARMPRKVLKKQDEFQFLHISLLREYLDLEFGSVLRDILSFPYSLERIIDDWIILAFFVGNDFLPHLPTLDIGEGGLDTLFAIYKEELTHMGGYVFDRREINWQRLERVTKRMGELEEQVFAERQSAAIEYARKQKRKERRAPVIEIAEDELFEGESPSPDPDELLAAVEDVEEKEQHTVFDSQLSMLIRPSDGSAPIHRDEHGRVMDPESMSFKQLYYRSKFPEFYDRSTALLRDSTGSNEKEPETPQEHIRRLVQNYAQGLKWVAAYYYEGCRSWKWFFAYRYAPLASDLIDLASLDLTLPLGYPFRPLEQLLGVLPPASGKFLPPAYRALMDPRTSPVADFYPLDFSVDMNGKRSAWEGIALIPFIDESRLLRALQNIRQEQLTETERQRNARYGEEVIFEYDPTNTETIPPSNPAFAPIHECHSKMTTWNVPSIPMTAEEQVARDKYEADTLAQAERAPADQLMPVPAYYAGNFAPQLCPGVQVPAPGYPSLQVSAQMNDIALTPALKKVSVNVFGMESKKDSLVLTVDKSGSAQLSTVDMARRFLNQRVFVEWPFLKEAQVARITDATHVWTTGGGRQMTVSEASTFQTDCIMAQQQWLNTRAVDVGPVTVLFGVHLFIGMKRAPNGAIVRAFSEEVTTLPYQLIFPHIPKPDPRYKELPPPSVEDAFPIGSTVVYTGPQHYGSVGRVTRIGPGQTLSIKLSVEPPEATFGRTIATESRLQYYPSYLVSKSLSIHPLVLSKIASSVFVQQERTDIGLKVKFAKQSLQVPEYARRVEAWSGAGTKNAANGAQNRNNNAESAQQGSNEGWEYSEKCVALLAAYKRRFPLLFELMNEEPHTFKYDGSRLVPPTPANSSSDLSNPVPTKTASDAIEEIADWLKTVGINNLPLVPCSSMVMAERGIKALEQEATRLAKLRAKQPKKEVVLDGVPIYHLYRPDPVVPWSPTEADLPDLGDRVLCVRSDRGAPFGLRGTVVCVHMSRHVEVVFDEAFMSGNNLHNKCSNLRGQTLPFTSVINLSKPKILAPKSQLAKPAKNNLQRQQKPTQHQQGIAAAIQSSTPQASTQPPAAAPTTAPAPVPQILKRPVAAPAPAPVASSAPVPPASSPVDAASLALKQMLQIGGQPATSPSSAAAPPVNTAIAAPAHAPIPTPVATSPATSAASVTAPSAEEETDPMQRMLAKGKARKAKAAASASAAQAQTAIPVGPMPYAPMHFAHGQPVIHPGQPHNAMLPPGPVQYQPYYPPPAPHQQPPFHHPAAPMQPPHMQHSCPPPPNPSHPQHSNQQRK